MLLARGPQLWEEGVTFTPYLSFDAEYFRAAVAVDDGVPFFTTPLDGAEGRWTGGVHFSVTWTQFRGDKSVLSLDLDLGRVSERFTTWGGDEECLEHDPRARFAAKGLVRHSYFWAVRLLTAVGRPFCQFIIIRYHASP